VRVAEWLHCSYAIILAAVVLFASDFAAGRFVMHRFSAEGLQFGGVPPLNVFAILAGLVVLVLAEVFEAGTRLDEEQSLTI
jgi:hypothetical protein